MAFRLLYKKRGIDFHLSTLLGGFMTFDEWWGKKLQEINSARIHLSPEYIKVYFENAYEYGKASERFASQQASGVDRATPCGICGVVHGLKWDGECRRPGE